MIDRRRRHPLRRWATGENAFYDIVEPPLENHRAAFRDAMREMVAEMEEYDPGSWQRAVDNLMSDEPSPIAHLILPMPDKFPPPPTEESSP